MANYKEVTNYTRANTKEVRLYNDKFKFTKGQNTWNVIQNPTIACFSICSLPLAVAVWLSHFVWGCVYKCWLYQITIVLLPVIARIEYKICTFCFHVLHSKSTPLYLKELLKPYTPPRLLRSRTSNLLFTPRYKQENFGKRALSVLGPKLWNSLPFSIRSSKSITIFKKSLKTHLFKKFLVSNRLS